MEGIPPALPSDSEDVVWALETAQSLWKKDARVDAIVWLRRAAEAAGLAEDDERAMVLARNAAELTDFIARTSNAPAPVPDLTSLPPIPDLSEESKVHLPDLSSEGDIDEEVSVSVDFGEKPEEPSTNIRKPTPDELAVVRGRTPLPPPPGRVPGAPAPFPPAPSAPNLDAPRSPVDAATKPLAPPMRAGKPPPLPPGAKKPPPPLPKPPAAADSSARISAPPPMREKLPSFPVSREIVEATGGINVEGASGEVSDIDSDIELATIPPLAPDKEPIEIAIDLPDAVPMTPINDGEFELKVERPSRGGMKAVRVPTPAPMQAVLSSEVPAPTSDPPEPTTGIFTSPKSAGAFAEPMAVPVLPPFAVPPAFPAAASAPPSAPPPLPSAPPPLPASAADVRPAIDLSNHEAFADLPDDARDDFARAGVLHHLAVDEEVSGFALALVVSGAFDVSATMIDAAAERIKAGAVLRGEGTMQSIELRVVAATDQATVATWTMAQVEHAFKSCPWVDEDLAAAADRTHALVGVTMGPLAERLDADLRQQFTDKLSPRKLEPGEVLVEKGASVPGVLIVGVGEIELVDGDVVQGTVERGNFVFATEILGGGKASVTARAGKKGCIILSASRLVAQEMMVTCPPLLEIFAGM